MKATMWLAIGLIGGIALSGHQAVGAAGTAPMSRVWIGLEIPEWLASMLPPALVIREADQCKTAAG